MVPIIALLATVGQGAAADVRLQPGMVITRSARIVAAPSLLPSPDVNTPAITIRGDNITVDFNKIALRGTPTTTEPDQRKGLAVWVSGRNITIKNARIHGYMVGIRANNAPGLKIFDSDLSYNWKQRLKSTQEREDVADWMSYHQNEKDEWLRYGAAIYFRDVDNFEVRGVRVTGGQNGLMITNANRGLIWNNDFSFNSSMGLGMYRSSDNRIMHNKMDWNVRGFSYGVYNRGQDSTGILIYEQSHRNVFAYNSVTHGGDGFFLWAGQTTMDTGQGGCNDNLLLGNDWSHAPTNGIEATFSRNFFINNKVHECAHGVWGGYSYDTVIALNDFADNQAAIAIEHGQANQFLDNSFYRDDVAISLWANTRQDPNWGYPKNRDTRSRDTIIRGNIFEDNGIALDQRLTSNTTFENNVLDNVFRAIRVPDTETAPVANNRTTEAKRPEWNPWRRLSGQYAKYNVERLKGGMDPFLKPGALRGWRYILVDNWGPYDFRRPLLWPERKPLSGEAPRPGANSASGSGRPRPQKPAETGPARYEILGPKGRWRLVSAEGATLSATSGTVPGFVTIETVPGRVGTTKVELEYIGEATTDYRGIVTPRGRPVRFGFEKFNAPIDWNVSFYKWTKSIDASNPLAIPDEQALQQIFAGQPVKTVKLPRLDFNGATFDREVGSTNYATRAEGTFEVPAGDYTIEITTDDGARVWLDGKPLIEDAWKYQGPTPYARNVRLGGRHTLRVEHFQISGHAALKVEIKPRR